MLNRACAHRRPFPPVAAPPALLLLLLRPSAPPHRALPSVRVGVHARACARRRLRWPPALECMPASPQALPRGARRRRAGRAGPPPSKPQPSSMRGLASPTSGCTPAAGRTRGPPALPRLTATVLCSISTRPGSSMACCSSFWSVSTTSAGRGGEAQAEEPQWGATRWAGRAAAPSGQPPQRLKGEGAGKAGAQAQPRGTCSPTSAHQEGAGSTAAARESRVTAPHTLAGAWCCVALCCRAVRERVRGRRGWAVRRRLAQKLGELLSGAAEKPPLPQQ